MTKVHAEASHVIDAPAQQIYDVLADYENGHPNILPKEHFSDLVIESGGKGNGTIIRFKMILLFF